MRAWEPTVLLCSRPCTYDTYLFNSQFQDLPPGRRRPDAHPGTMISSPRFQLTKTAGLSSHLLPRLNGRDVQERKNSPCTQTANRPWVPQASGVPQSLRDTVRHGLTPQHATQRSPIVSRQDDNHSDKGPSSRFSYRRLCMPSSPSLPLRLT